MSLARLRRQQGRPQEAVALLDPTLGWFTEGFDTADLKEAKTLLDKLTEPAIARGVSQMRMAGFSRSDHPPGPRYRRANPAGGRTARRP
jgi:hypothetical protein